MTVAVASVVALRDLYGEFDITIVGDSWVLTTSAVSVTATAIPVALGPPPRPASAPGTVDWLVDRIGLPGS